LDNNRLGKRRTNQELKVIMIRLMIRIATYGSIGLNIDERETLPIEATIISNKPMGGRTKPTPLQATAIRAK
jgi:hypothetical protein